MFQDLDSKKPLDISWDSERRDKLSSSLPHFPSMPQLRANRKLDQGRYEGREPRSSHSSFPSPWLLISASVFATRCCTAAWVFSVFPQLPVLPQVRYLCLRKLHGCPLQLKTRKENKSTTCLDISFFLVQQTHFSSGFVLLFPFNLVFPT